MPMTRNRKIERSYSLPKENTKEPVCPESMPRYSVQKIVMVANGKTKMQAAATVTTDNWAATGYRKRSGSVDAKKLRSKCARVNRLWFHKL